MSSLSYGLFASLGLRIRSTSMALSVCRVFALVWSVERMVPGWISYFDLRLRSGRLPFPDCKATHAASLKPMISLVAMENFKDVMARRAVPIDQQLNRLVERQINDNRD